MSMSITCDKCGKAITGDFVRVISDFYTFTDDHTVDFMEFCAHGDRIFMCDRCYEDTLGKAVDE